MLKPGLEQGSYNMWDVQGYALGFVIKTRMFYC